jgi:hypothetical protein
VVDIGGENGRAWTSDSVRLLAPAIARHLSAVGNGADRRHVHGQADGRRTGCIRAVPQRLSLRPDPRRHEGCAGAWTVDVPRSPSLAECPRSTRKSLIPDPERASLLRRLSGFRDGTHERMVWPAARALVSSARLPQVTLRERCARARFQVLLERDGTGFVCEFNHDIHTPRSPLLCVRAAPRVVSNKPRRHVSRQARVMPAVLVLEHVDEALRCRHRPGDRKLGSADKVSISRRKLLSRGSTVEMLAVPSKG